jgi:hypothetical protein
LIQLTDRQIQNFWSKVRKTETCWIWTGWVGNTGYGWFKIGKSPKTVHRLAIILAGVEIPEDCCALHKCNVKLCVRYDPAHVYVGTRIQNSQDLYNAGYEHPVGEQAANSKLTEQIVKKIINLYHGRQVSVVALAKQYGVTRKQIYNIVQGKSWKYLRD